MKILAFRKKIVWVIQNLRLGIQSDKIWVDSSAQSSTLKYLTIYSADMPNFGIILKKISLGVRN